MVGMKFFSRTLFTVRPCKMRQGSFVSVTQAHTYVQ